MSYKRKPNMPKIISSLRSQKRPPKEIWLINNDGHDGFGADRLIAIPWNAGEMARYLWTRRVETEWVAFQDDDWMVGDNTFLQDALHIAENKAPNACVGVAGRHVYPKPKHYRQEAALDSYTNFLKGHFQVFNKRALRNLHVCYHPFASDIWFSLDISQGDRVHWVSGELKRRLVRLDTHGQGLEFRKGHWAEREKACADYITEYGRKYAWST
jgi:hypothetical protein